MAKYETSVFQFDFEEFEWDENKAKANLRKHGIDFEDAAQVFRTAVVVCPQTEEDENRWLAFGEAAGRIIAVVFTDEDARCRLISARRTSRREREEYYAILRGRSGGATGRQDRLGEG